MQRCCSRVVEYSHIHKQTGRQTYINLSFSLPVIVIFFSVLFSFLKFFLSLSFYFALPLCLSLLSLPLFTLSVSLYSFCQYICLFFLSLTLPIYRFLFISPIYKITLLQISERCIQDVAQLTI